MKHKIMQIMKEQDDSNQLCETVQLDDVYYSYIEKQGEQVGLIEFYRRKNAPNFSLNEIKLIEELSSILPLAMENCGQWNSHFMEVSHSGNLIIDNKGKIKYTCSQGKNFCTTRLNQILSIPLSQPLFHMKSSSTVKH